MLDSILEDLNVLACVLLASGATWAVLSPTVKDGVVVKIGMILIALGFASTAVLLSEDRLWALNRALALVHAGILVVGLGYALRTRGGRRKRRRSTDWMTLDSREVDSV